MTELVTIVLASTNPGKVVELRTLFADLPVQLLSVAEVLGEPLNVVEDGLTFEANAVLKARAVCAATRMLALADDSGLEVEALDGRPGVRSARYASERATDAENNAALLRELEDVADRSRSARFRCVLALVSPWKDGEVKIAEGTCEGLIARAPRGGGGFGYDPLFIVPAFDGRAMAELSEDEKNSISHRARAARALKPILIHALNERLDEVERITG